MKSILTLVLLAALTLQLQAQNLLRVPDVAGSARDTLTVTVEIDNHDAFVGFQFDLLLPDQTRYLDGSAATTERADGHSLFAQVLENRRLRVVCFSMNQRQWEGNSGAVVTFRVVLGAIPGSYPLQLEGGVIADADSRNIITGVVNGALTLRAPDVTVEPVSLDFDRVALGNHSDRSFRVTNNGNANLRLQRIFTDHADFTILGDTSGVLTPGQARDVTVRFTSRAKGLFNRRATIVSDDPDEGTTVVNLRAVAFAVNEMDVNDVFARSGHTVTLSVDIFNREPFVGFQFDLALPDVMAFEDGSAELTERADNHLVDASLVEAGRLRVVAFSPSNSPFQGDQGDVVELTFQIDGLGGWYDVRLENPIIADVDGANSISDYFGGRLEIAAPDVWINPGNLDFGVISIFDTSVVNLQIGNNGSDTLLIDGLQFSSNAFFTDVQAIRLPMNSSINIPVSFHSEESGDFLERLTIRSNDPDEDPVYINLSGEAFVPNRMSLSDVSVQSGSLATVSLCVDNFEPFAGFQCDITLPDGAEYLEGSARLTNRARDHQLMVEPQDDHRLRLLCFSMSQSEFSGDSRAVANFCVYVGEELGAWDLPLNNAILANAQGENILAATRNGRLTILRNSLQRFTDFRSTLDIHCMLVTSVTFDGEPSPANWEIGVFTPGGVLAGAGVWLDNPLGIAVWGADDNFPDQFQAGETMSLRLWDPQADEEFAGQTVVEEGALIWQSNGFTILAIESFSARSLEVQLRPSWNMISINVAPAAEWYDENEERGPSVIRMMSDLVNRNQLILMKNKDGNFYSPEYGFNGIPYWNLTEGYQVKVSEATSVTWTGEPIAFDADIPLRQGWNMIAYFPDYDLSCQHPDYLPFSNILQYVEIAKDINGNFASPEFEYSGMPPWRETQGYQIKVTQDAVLNYPPNHHDGFLAPADPIESSQRIVATPFNMSLLLTAFREGVDGKISRIQAVNTAGMVVGEGVVTFGEPCGLAVWGDDPATDELEGLKDGETFRLVGLGEAGAAVPLEAVNLLAGEGLVYVTDGFTAVEVAEADIPEEFGISAIYPNPFNATAVVSFSLDEVSTVTLELFDVSGRLISEVFSGELCAGRHQQTIHADRLSSGVYLCKLTDSHQRAAMHKLLLMK